MMTNEDQPRSGTEDETPDVPFDSPSPHSVGPPPPPEMFALYLETTDGRWTLASVLFDRTDAEYRGKMNRMRRPWRVHTYRLVKPELPTGRCVLCNDLFTGYGHNPEPLADYEAGRACDVCNDTRVVPERIRRIRESDRG